MDQKKLPKLIIRKPTIQEDKTIVNDLINELPFIHKQGYKIYLSEDVKNKYPQFSENIISTKDISFSYKQALQELESVRNKIEQVFPIFITLHEAWDFHLPHHYELLVTKYGIGQYFPETAKILITVSQVFKDTIEKIRTPIHEMVHIGIEQFVEEFHLSQTEKEGTVDVICKAAFSEILDYTPESVSDQTIMNYLNSKNILANLPKLLKDYKTEHFES